MQRTTDEKSVKLTKKVLRTLYRYATKCSEGDEYSCREYNALVSRISPPFTLYRGVDCYGARRNLMKGVIEVGLVRDQVTYFTLLPEYAECYSGAEGIIYAVRVTSRNMHLFKSVKYSTSVKQVKPTSLSDEYQPYFLAKELAFIAGEVPLDKRYVSILYPVLPSIPPKPASKNVEEIVDEFKKKGFRVYPYYLGMLRVL